MMQGQLYRQSYIDMSILMPQIMLFLFSVETFYPTIYALCVAHQVVLQIWHKNKQPFEVLSLVCTISLFCHERSSNDICAYRSLLKRVLDYG